MSANFREMSPGQMATFTEVMSVGATCALFTIFEAYEGWMLHVPSLMPHDEQAEAIRKVQDAFVAFMNTTLAPEEPPYTLERFENCVGEWYNYVAEQRKPS